MSFPSSRLSSDIWNHFTKTAEKKGKCRYCQLTLSFSSSTSNLKRHLKTKHPTVPLERSGSRSRSPSSGDDREIRSFQSPTSDPSTSTPVEDLCTPSRSGSESGSSFYFTTPSPPTALQQSLSRFVNIIKPIPLNKSRAIDTQLLKVICKEYHPFSIVENKEFQNFIKMLSPNYNLPSRKTLSNSLLPALYNELLDKIKLDLADAKAVCLTSDGWTNINNISFYALTAHFINKDSQMKSYLLECSEFEDRHTAQNISSWIDSVVRKFEIHFKITAIVTDNAANMKAAAAKSNILHIPCFAHSLNLIVQHAINESIEKIVGKVKSIVMHFKKSPFALSKLTSMQTNLKKEKLKLKQDVPTRWNSTFDMLERFNLNKDPIIFSLAILGVKTFNLVDKDWDIIQQAVEILRVFYEVTKEISSEKTVSISKMGILIRLMARNIKSYQKENKNCCEEINTLLENLLNGLTERFGELSYNELVTQATLLDPRFKKQAFDEDEGKYRDCYNSILAQMKSLVARQPTPESQTTPAEPTCTSSGSSIWEDFDERVRKVQGTHDPGSAAIVELDKYISETYLARNNDPLVWWDARKLIYPTLYKIVLKRLCIPATSVPCERIFSKAGQICTEKRNRLSGGKISQILFLNHNM